MKRSTQDRIPGRLSLALTAALAPSLGAQTTPLEAIGPGLDRARSDIEGRHAVRPVDAGYEARNPGQRWLTHFDGRGVTVEPEAGSWTWGLELERYGFPGQERPVSTPACTSAEAGRVAYDWDDVLREWYVNDARGLEHGYTVHRRPTHDGRGALVFTLAVRGDLKPEVLADGRDVRFLDAAGRVVLTYTGLAVFDANGCALPARFERVAEGLTLTVDQRDARYPLTIDPIAQQAYLKASNTDPSDAFGWSVAVDGDRLAVAAPSESSSATGVNGDQSDNSAQSTGAVYVFARSGATWNQEAYLKASNADAHDAFGRRIAMSGDTLVVGSREEDSNATGVDGNQNDNSANIAGAAYVFVRSGTTWSQQAYLKASNTDAGDQFGHAVGISGDTIVIGAPTEDSAATGVNGDQGDNSSSVAGAAYVFVRSGTTWTQQAYLKASNTDECDQFGISVAISGDTILVGARHEDSAATGVNGDEADDSALDSGAVYVFVRSGTTWTQQAYLKASNTQQADDFGCMVALSGDTAAISALGEDSAATGVNGNQADNSADNSGAVYVFVRSGTTWTQEAYVKASNTEGGILDDSDQFGFSLAVVGDTMVVGTPMEDSGATGLHGDQSDNSAGESGALYFFTRNGTTWSQEAYLKASNTESNDNYGRTVALSSDTLAVGAPRDDSSATGVNGDQSDNSSINSGAAFAYSLGAEVRTYCFCAVGAPCGNEYPFGGCANSSGSGAILGATGSTSIAADTLVLTATQIQPNRFGMIFRGTSALSNLPFNDGQRCIGGNVRRHLVRNSGAGGVISEGPGYIALTNQVTPLAGNITAGSTWNFQCWYRDGMGPCASTANLSNAVSVLFAP